MAGKPKTGKRCWNHTYGVAPGTPPFFVEGCPQCEAKRAAGKVRGDEGPVGRRFSGRQFRVAPMPKEQFEARMAQVHEGRRRRNVTVWG